MTSPSPSRAMHFTFNPPLCQETTVPLPGNAAHHDLQFKATFDSKESYEQAKRDGTRVEMWTDLPAIGGTDEVGGWRALAFAFPECLHQAESDKGEVFLSCVPSQQSQVDAGESEKSVYLNARLDSAAVQGTPTFSFTYRLVYRDGGVQWLGAFGQNGVLGIEKRDARLSADESRAELGEDWLKAKGQIGDNVGALNPELKWEGVAFDKNGVMLSSSFPSSPAYSVFLIPRIPNGSHSLVALRPLLITADAPSKEISISSSGIISVQKADSDGRFESVAGYPLVLGANTRVVSTDLSSRYTVFATGGGIVDTYPLTITATPLGRGLAEAPFADVRINASDLLSLLPMDHSDAVLFRKGSAKGYTVVSANKSNDVLTIRVPTNGSQIIFAPLHHLEPTAGETSVQIGIVSPHRAVEVVVPVQPSPEDAFPTPPPSPPAQATPLSETETQAKEVTKDCPPKEEDRTEEVVCVEVEELAIVEETRETVIVSDSVDVESDLLAATRATEPASPLTPSASEVPYIGTVARAQPRVGAPIQIGTIIRMGLEYLLKALAARFWGFLWVLLSWFGWTKSDKAVESGAEDDEVDDDEVQRDERVEVVTEAEAHIDTEISVNVSASSLAEATAETQGISAVEQHAAEVEESPSEVTFVEEDVHCENEKSSVAPVTDDITPIASPPGKEALHISVKPETVGRSPYLSAQTLSKGVAFLVRTSGPSLTAQNLSVKVDGEAYSNITVEPLDTATAGSFATYLVAFEGPASHGSIEISVI